jgi:hypothetical protein
VINVIISIFWPIFGEKNWHFSLTNCFDYFLPQKAAFSVQNANFPAIFFSTLVPGLDMINEFRT